jgi:outer membrane protein assembly factor BamB/plastocyanin
MSRISHGLRIVAVLTLTLLLGGGYLLAEHGSFAQQSNSDENADQQPATPSPLGPAIPPEVSANADSWPMPTGDYQAHRAATNSTISTSTVSQLNVDWTFDLTAQSGFGSITSVPVVTSDTIYLQDMQSNVYALDRTSGQVKWEKEYNIGTEGPNGVTIGYGHVFGSLGNPAEVFALDAATGDEVWRIKLTNNDQTGVDMAPTVYNNVLYISTVPGNGENFYQGGQKGILYALDAATGSELWEFDTTTDNLWGNARINSGGGLWYPPSVDEQGNIYFGTGNAAPWPGVVANGTPYPNGSSRSGDNDYASSMVSLDPTTGAVRWNVNAKPHDLFDLDFQLTPILTTVNINGVNTPVAIGSGKAGLVIAANADTGEVLWNKPVGKHENDDLQDVPEAGVEVAPAALGGTETPMAYADGVVYAPVINLPMTFGPFALDASSVDFSKATGELVAINVADGSIKWDIPLNSAPYAGATVANDVVFTAGLDGIVHGYNTADGSEVWSWQAPAGINAPLAIAGDTLYVPAGGLYIASANSPAGFTPSNQFVALRLGATGTPEPATTVESTIAPSEGTPVPATEVPPAEIPVASPVAESSGSTAAIALVDIAFDPKDLTIPANTDVTIQLTNNGAAVHNFNIDELNIHSGDINPGASGSVTINAAPGTYQYYCSIPGHKEAGMVGTLTVQ